MELFSWDPERLATALGSRPIVLVALMVGTVVLTLLAMALVVRVAGRRARRMWTHAARGWRWFAERPLMRRIEARVPFVWALVKRLSAAEYLLLHLALGLAVSFGVIVFLKIAGAVAAKHSIVLFDEALARALHSASTPTGIALLEALTTLGNGWVLTIVGVVVGAGLLIRRRPILAAGWAIALIGGGVLNQGLKSLYARPRPSFPEALSSASGWSFPSGHAMGTFVLVGMASYLGWRLARTLPRRLAIIGLAATWAILIGFSRMYLGVHFLSDVVAGFVAGSVWVAACISGLEIALRRPKIPSIDALPAPPPAAR